MDAQTSREIFQVRDVLKPNFVADVKHLKIISVLNTWSLKSWQD